MRGDQNGLGRDLPDGDNLPRPSKGLLVVGVLVILGVGMIFSMFYTVEADEVAVVQRFGKYVRREEPGLRTKMPFGLETVRKVKVQRVFKAEFGFRTEEPGVRTRFSQRSFNEESLMLTGDLNVAEVAWIVQYRIADPVKFLFRNRNPALALSDVAQIVMRSVIGDHTVTEVLTERRTEIALQVQNRMQELLNLYETGLRVETVQMQSVTPPSDEVKRAFNEVNEAQQEQSRKTNEAVQAYNQEVPRERGEVERTIAKAEGYAINRVNTAKGDAARFNALFAEYRKAPEVTRRRLYLETMREVLPAVKQVYVLDSSKQAAPVLPFIDLQRGEMTPAAPAGKDK
ncbi:MAG: FtsH protease activity modulator HflK [Candidatus Tectimicrobiota bacterium]